MFIFALKNNIFVVEGKNISETNRDIYKKGAFDYIKEIIKFEHLGAGIDIDKIEVIKQDDLEEKYKELINVYNIIITFSDVNNIDKLYID